MHIIIRLLIYNLLANSRKREASHKKERQAENEEFQKEREKAAKAAVDLLGGGKKPLSGRRMLTFLLLLGLPLLSKHLFLLAILQKCQVYGKNKKYLNW